MDNCFFKKQEGGINRGFINSDETHKRIDLSSLRSHHGKQKFKSRLKKYQNSMNVEDGRFTSKNFNPLKTNNYSSAVNLLRTSNPMFKERKRRLSIVRKKVSKKEKNRNSAVRNRHTVVIRTVTGKELEESKRRIFRRLNKIAKRKKRFHSAENKTLHKFSIHPGKLKKLKGNLKFIGFIRND